MFLAGALCVQILLDKYMSRMRVAETVAKIETVFVRGSTAGIRVAPELLIDIFEQQCDFPVSHVRDRICGILIPYGDEACDIKEIP